MIYRNNKSYLYFISPVDEIYFGINSDISPIGEINIYMYGIRLILVFIILIVRIFDTIN